MATHQAYQLHGYGGQENLRLDEVEVPSPGPGQVLVKVSAVGINPFDWKLREGWLKDEWDLKLPKVLGVDFCGSIASMGRGSWRFSLGDRVTTLSNNMGAYAEYIVVDENILSRVPPSMTDPEAAALPIPTMTAWTALHAAGKIWAGMKILVQGASGQAGAFAVQFAKAAGAYVIGVASEKNRHYVTGLGADEFIDYRTQKFEDLVKDADLILDFILVGGEQENSTRSWSALKPGGAFVTVSDPAALAQVPDGYRGFFPNIDPDVARLEDIAEQIVSGRLKSKVARVFPRKELPQGLEMSKAGGAAGRLVLDFSAT